MTFETIIKSAGGLLAFTTLAILLFGVVRGARRQTGRTAGNTSLLRSTTFYFAASALFFSAAWLGWTPLPVSPAPSTRTWMLVIGTLFYFPGMALVLWGRLALNENYFVSTGLGAQLFAGQKLVTNGPYVFVRHPMYVGVFLVAWGAFLIYFTWTTIFFILFTPMVILRAHREEQVLAAEFGEKWTDYCKRVPAFIPHFRKEK